MDLNRDKEIYQNLNQWLKICKTSYTRRSVNNQKVQKFVRVLEVNLIVKNAPKRPAKYLQDKTCKIKQMQNISLPEDIFKSTKNVLEKFGTKEDSYNTTTSKVLSKICNRKNLHSNNTTFPCLKVL